MKISHLAFSLIISLVSASCNAESKPPKMYQEKSGVVTSVITIGFKEPFSTITEVLVWDDWGMRIAKYQTNNETQEGTKTVIRLKADSSDSYKLALDQAALINLPSGEHKPVPYRAIDTMNSFNAKEKQDMATAFIRSSGMFEETSKQKNIAGHSCKLWQVETNPKHTNCIWQGIILETNQSAGGMRNHKKAVDVKLEEVDSQHFEVPGLLKPT